MNTTLSRPSMAKFTGAFAALIALMLILAGCSSNQESVTKLVKSEYGLENIITYYAEGDLVTKQTSKTILDYGATFGTTDIDAVKEAVAPFSAPFENLNGVVYNIEFGETFLTETLEIDYSVAKPADLAQLPGSQFEGDIESNKVSLKMSKEILENDGYQVMK